MAQAHRYGLLVKGKEEVVVPLKNVSVTAQLKGSLVGLLSKFSYKNETADPLEVLFRFPVDESWAVVGLEAVIDGRRILAEVKEKEEAKEMPTTTRVLKRTDSCTSRGSSEKSGDIFSLAGELLRKCRRRATVDDALVSCRTDSCTWRGSLFQYWRHLQPPALGNL